MIEPVAGILEGLKRIIDREQDPIGPDLRHSEIQRRRREMPGGRDPDVPRKVLADGPLARRRETEMLLPVLEPVVDPPQVERDVLTQVAQDELKVGVPVEEAVGHHPQDVQTDALREAERRAEQPFFRSAQSLSYTVPVELRGCR